MFCTSKVAAKSTLEVWTKQAGHGLHKLVESLLMDSTSSWIAYTWTAHVLGHLGHVLGHLGHVLGHLGHDLGLFKELKRLDMPINRLDRSRKSDENECRICVTNFLSFLQSPKILTSIWNFGGCAIR